MTNYTALLLTGILAGFINVTSAGGSLITLPLMIFLGMPPVVANGTNRIAVLIQNIVAAGNFRRHGRKDLRTGFLFGLAAAPGAAIGALTAVHLSDTVFKWVLASAILLGLSVVLFHKQPPAGQEVVRKKWLQMLLFLFIGFYGGVIQAGTGYLIIFSLTMVGGLGLAKTNSIKVVVISIYLIPSILVFAKEGCVQLLPGLALAAGGSIGGFLGSSFSHSMNPKWTRLILAVVLTAMTVKLLTAL
jgi:uncharacterized membrane protein YfcA